MTITKEQLEEYVKTDEGKAFFNDLVTEGGYKSATDIENLVAKNRQLLGKLAKTKQSSETLKQLNSIFEENELALEDLTELDVLIKKGKSTSGKDSEDLSKLERELKKFKTERDEYENKYKSIKEKRVDTELKSTIWKSLKEVKVSDDAMDFLVPYFKGLSIVEEEEDGYELRVLAKDEEGLSPTMSDFIKSWAKTDKAKSFIKAPATSGAGGGGGSGGKDESVNMTAEEISRVTDPVKRKLLLKKAGYI